MTDNLGLTQMATTQNNPENVHNDANAEQDAAITEFMTADVTSGNVLITSLQYRRNQRIYITGAGTAGREVTLQAIKRLMVIVANTANTEDVDLILGTTTIVVAPGVKLFVYTDGTANGLEVIIDSLGVSTWLGLSDTPGSFSGQAGKVSAVNSGETAMELVEQTGGSGGAGVQLTRKIRGALAYRDTDQTGIVTSTWTPINFDKEHYDTDTLHDLVTNNSRMTVPTGVTKVQLVGKIRWDSNATNNRQVRISKNGASFSGITQEAQGAIPDMLMSISTNILQVIPGDYFELEVWQDSGSNRVIGSFEDNSFCMEIVEDSDATDVQSVAIAALPRHKGALVDKSANQSIGTGSWVALTFNQETRDTDNFHDTATNNERMTIPAGVRKVRLRGNFRFASVADVTVRGSRFTKNGVEFLGSAQSIFSTASASGSANEIASPVLDVVQGDYFEFEVFQGSAGSIDIESSDYTWFAIEVVEADPAADVPTGFIAIQPTVKGAMVEITSVQLMQVGGTEVVWDDAVWQRNKGGQKFWLGPQLTFTADNTTEELTATAHGMETGDGPFQLTNSGGGLPAGLATATDYWCIRISANVLKVASSYANAIALTEVTFTTDGTGTHTLDRATRLVVPQGVTMIKLRGNCRWDDTTFNRTMEVYKNGAGFPDGFFERNDVQRGEMSGSCIVEVVAGDKFELRLGPSTADDVIASHTWFTIEAVEQDDALSFPGVTVERPHIGCLVKKSGNQAIASASDDPVTFDQEDYDTGYRGVAFHDNAINNSRITIPAGVVKVDFVGCIQWESNSTNGRYIALYKNGVAFQGGGRSQYVAYAKSQMASAWPVLEVVEGDYFELIVWQDSGASRNIETGVNTYFSCTVIETDEAAFVPEQIETFLGGVPATSDIVYGKVAHRRFSLADNFAGSEAKAITVAPTSAIILDVKRDGTKIGEINFAASVSTATFTTTASVEEVFEVGEYLTIVTPANLFTAEDIAISLKGWRS